MIHGKRTINLASGDILHLFKVLDRERERIRQIIANRKIDDMAGNAEIPKLDRMIEKLESSDVIVPSL